jgi:hypothetical protein
MKGIRRVEGKKERTDKTLRAGERVSLCQKVPRLYPIVLLTKKE